MSRPGRTACVRVTASGLDGPATASIDCVLRVVTQRPRA